jgi:hypothetical protein
MPQVTSILRRNYRTIGNLWLWSLKGCDFLLLGEYRESAWIQALKRHDWGWTFRSAHMDWFVCTRLYKNDQACRKSFTNAVTSYDMLWHDDQFLYFNFELGHSEAVAPLENCLLGHWVTKDWKAMTRIYCQTLCANSWVLVTRWWVSIYTWTRHRQTPSDAQLSQPGGIFRAQATGRPRSLETGNLTLDPLGSSDTLW